MRILQEPNSIKYQIFYYVPIATTCLLSLCR